MNDIELLKTELQEAQKERDQLRQQLTEAQAAIVVKDEALKHNVCACQWTNRNEQGEIMWGGSRLVRECDSCKRKKQALQPNCGQPLLEVVKEMKSLLYLARFDEHPDQTRRDGVITKAKEIEL